MSLAERQVILLLTPCIYKRGLIWLLFFAISFFAVQFIGDESESPTPAKTYQGKQQTGGKQ